MIYALDTMTNRDGQDTWEIHSRVALNLDRRVGCTAADSTGVYLFITDSAWVE